MLAIEPSDASDVYANFGRRGGLFTLVGSSIVWAAVLGWLRFEG